MKVGISPNNRTSGHIKTGTPFIKALKKDCYYYILLLIPLAYFIIFKYVPLIGNIIAIRRYSPGQSIYGTGSLTLKYFQMFLTDPAFYNALKNTLVLSTMTLTITFPIPVVFVLLLNEIRNSYFKRIVQTVSYLPKFLSTIIVVSIIKIICSPSTGIINHMLEQFFNMEPIFFVNDENWFRPLYIISEIWQFMGWNCIIYLAALTNINPQLYEASMIDGASRFRQAWHITLPGIRPTIVINFIISVGYLLYVGFEKIFLLYTPENSATADVLDMLIYRMGIKLNSFSYATAVGLFASLTSLVFVALTNYIAGKFSDTKLY